MESPFEEFENIDSLTDQEIFLKIWTEPRRVLRYIHEKNYTKYAYVLLYLVGFSNVLDNASTRNLGDQYSLIFIFVIAFFGGLFGWIGLYIYSALISFTGRMLDGKSNTDAIFGILPYCHIPTVCSLALLLLQILIFGIEPFKDYSFVIEESISNSIIFMILVVFELLLSLYSLVLLTIGVSEVQKFGIGKAIINLIAPILLLLIPIAIFLAFFYFL